VGTGKRERELQSAHLSPPTASLATRTHSPMAHLLPHSIPPCCRYFTHSLKEVRERLALELGAIAAIGPPSIPGAPPIATDWGAAGNCALLGTIDVGLGAVGRLAVIFHNRGREM